MTCQPPSIRDSCSLLVCDENLSLNSLNENHVKHGNQYKYWPCCFPSGKQWWLLKPLALEGLEALLTYTWDKDKLQELSNRGTTIEVFFGEKDKIIDAKATFEFFSSIVTTYMIKDAGHILNV